MRTETAFLQRALVVSIVGGLLLASMGFILLSRYRQGVVELLPSANDDKLSAASIFSNSGTTQDTLTLAAQLKYVWLFYNNWSSAGVTVKLELEKFISNHSGIELQVFDPESKPETVTQLKLQSYPALVLFDANYQELYRQEPATLEDVQSLISVLDSTTAP